MLFLDAQLTSGAPNETSLAVMELFTMGVGNYTEDVRGARAPVGISMTSLSRSTPTSTTMVRRRFSGGLGISTASMH